MLDLKTSAHWNGRDNAFDFLRLLLSLTVVLSHCWPIATGNGLTEPIGRLTHGRQTLGGIAVDFFFVISGFMITASALRSKSLVDYFKRRVQRIYPAFVAVMLVGFFVVKPLSGSNWHVGMGHQIVNFVCNTIVLRPFYMDGAFAKNPLPGIWNASLWTIQYEFICYIGVAILLRLGILQKRIRLLLLSVTMWIASYLWVVHAGAGSTQDKFVDQWLRLAPCYLSGVCFFLYRDRIQKSPLLALIAIAGLAASTFTPFGDTLSIPFLGSYLIFYLAFEQSLHLPRIGKYGDFSYGIYLYAFPIQQLVVQHFAMRLPLELFLTATPICLVFAIISWFAIERPFLNSKRKKESLSTQPVVA